MTTVVAVVLYTVAVLGLAGAVGVIAAHIWQRHVETDMDLWSRTKGRG